MGWYTCVMANQSAPNPEEIQVVVPEKLRAGKYTNVSQINVSKHEVTITFIYYNPNDNPQGTVVSRVVLPRDHATGLIGSLKAAIDTANELDGEK